MNKKTNLKKGFSLIELMIVVAVMAILSTVGFFAYNNFQKTARDSKRKADLKTVGTALQAYYSDNGNYPVPNSATADGHEDANDVGGSSNLALALATYGGKVPLAPVVSSMTGENVQYQYAYDFDSASSKGKTYALCAQLEANPAMMLKVSSADPAGTVVANAVCAAP